MKKRGGGLILSHKNYAQTKRTASRWAVDETNHSCLEVVESIKVCLLSTGTRGKEGGEVKRPCVLFC